MSSNKKSVLTLEERDKKFLEGHEEEVREITEKFFQDLDKDNVMCYDAWTTIYNARVAILIEEREKRIRECRVKIHETTQASLEEHLTKERLRAQGQIDKALSLDYPREDLERLPAEFATMIVEEIEKRRLEMKKDDDEIMEEHLAKATDLTLFTRLKDVCLYSMKQTDSAQSTEFHTVGDFSDQTFCQLVATSDQAFRQRIESLPPDQKIEQIAARDARRARLVEQKLSQLRRSVTEVLANNAESNLERLANIETACIECSVRTGSLTHDTHDEEDE
jgi:hypothetical protein